MGRRVSSGCIGCFFQFFMMVAVLGGSCVCSEPIGITVYPERTHQIIDGFGASDAWQCDFVGRNWPLVKRMAMAELLFSREVNEEGSPKGIGLSIWRFNIGAGSAEQDDKSGIRNTWRRASGFLNGDGTYDWSRQIGQQWFLRQAKGMGVERFIAFANSPPVSLTRSGRAYPDGTSNTMNLRDDAYDKYADFLANVARHFADEGLPFDYISPVNEPQWTWEKGGQEGTPATNGEIFSLTKALSAALASRNVSTQILLPEAAKLDFLYGGSGVNENQLNAFWGQDSDLRFKGIPGVAPVACGHSYFTTWPIEKLRKVRRELKVARESLNQDVAFWMTEYCILQENIAEYDIGNGRPRDPGINTALYYARVIHHDLTVADASSWQFWTAISRSNHKDGLIYLNAPGLTKDDKSSDSLQWDGDYMVSKSLWALGNYSRFVRPGMQRMEVEISPGANPQFFVSAYKDDGSGKQVAVVVNYAEQDVSVTLNDVKTDVAVYTTSRDKNLKRDTFPAAAIPIERRSIVTIEW